MAGLPKSIIAKWGVTKKAWAEFRKRKRKGAGSPKRTTKRRKHTARRKQARRAEPAAKREEVKMPKRRKSTKARARRAARRLKIGMESRPAKVIQFAAMATAGGVGTSMIVNKAPIIKDQARGTKALVQAGVGVLAIMFSRNRYVKGLGAGAVVAGAMSAAQEFLKVQPLAGPSAGSRTLTPSEMRRLTSGQMNMPLPGQTMNAPLSSAPANAGFGRAGFGS